MTRHLIAAVAVCIGLATAAVAAEAWIRHDDPALGYSIDIPGPIQSTTVEKGEPDNRYPLTTVTGTAGGGAEYSVMISVYEGVPRDVRRTLQAGADGYASFPGDVVLSRTETTVDGYPAIDVQVRGADGYVGQDRLIIRGNTLFQVIVGAQDALPPGAARIRDSIKIHPR